MNELDCRRMLTIAKMVRNVATNDSWPEDDQARILAELAISAYEEIGRLKADKMILRVACEETIASLGDALTKTKKVLDQPGGKMANNPVRESPTDMGWKPKEG